MHSPVSFHYVLQKQCTAVLDELLRRQQKKKPSHAAAQLLDRLSGLRKNAECLEQDAIRVCDDWTNQQLIIKILRKQRDEYKEKLDVKVETLSLERLNALEVDLRNRLDKVQECRQRIIGASMKCITCHENKKNICFVDGCGHVCICDECEEDMEIKMFISLR